jgi:hypothetical protein
VLDIEHCFAEMDWLGSAISQSIVALVNARPFQEIIGQSPRSNLGGAWYSLIILTHFHSTGSDSIVLFPRRTVDHHSQYQMEVLFLLYWFM